MNASRKLIFYFSGSLILFGLAIYDYFNEDYLIGIMVLLTAFVFVVIAIFEYQKLKRKELQE